MARYKLMFKEQGQKRYYNFAPTMSKSANPRYSKIDTHSKAETIKRECEKNWRSRTWKITRK